MKKLLHVRNKELQTATFTEATALTQENGAAMHLEDGTTLLEIDGSASWIVQIIRVPPLKKKFSFSLPETYTFTGVSHDLVDENAEDIVDETGGEILLSDAETWTVPLIHV